MKNILTFPDRGDPTPDIEGYDRDPGNPRVFRMKWIPCELRVIVTPCKGCVESSRIQYCNYLDKPAEQNECNQCGGKSKPAPESKLMEVIGPVIQEAITHVIGRVIEESLDMNNGVKIIT
jgi:hypothetical protein